MGEIVTVDGGTDILPMPQIAMISQEKALKRLIFGDFSKKFMMF